MQKAIPLLVVALLLLTACSSPTDSPPKPPETSKGQPQQGNSDHQMSETKKEDEDQLDDKTEEQIQKEIREKLGRMTHPKGYSLPLNHEGFVQGVSTLDEVEELLRKKGYAPEIARSLTEEFYQVKGSGVTLIARDGAPGVFDPEKPAAFFKKNKWTWTVEQEHKDDALHGSHVASYEVELLKDGNYRLNRWKTKPL
jgi:hypothetical protein